MEIKLNPFYDYDFSNILPTLKQHMPDIMVLQEIEDTKYNGNRIHLPQWLGDQLNYSVFSHQYRSSFGGVTVLTRYNISSSKVVSLPSKFSQRPRFLLISTINTPSGEMTIFGTHLDPPTHTEVQIKQINTIINQSKNYDDHIILCDCNTPDVVASKPYRLLTNNYNDGWILSGESPIGGNTWPTSNPLLRVDYIWIKGEIGVIDGSADRIGDPNMSDHYGLLAEIVM